MLYEVITKTSTGKYVSPIGIEQKLCAHELIGNALVVAEGRKYVSCLLFPAFEEFEELRKKWGFPYLSLQAFYGHPQVQEALANHIECINLSLT